VSSSALDAWFGIRKDRLDELLSMHAKATGTGPGRRYGTTEFNRTLVTALVAQFQGFARDLHDLAVTEFVRTLEPPTRADKVRQLLTQGRKLDERTPRRSTLGSDFGRLGIELIDAVKGHHADSADRLHTLDQVVELRNAVGHGNEAEIARLVQEGYKTTKTAFRKYRRTFNGLAETMDEVVAIQLSSILGMPRPW